MGENGVAEIKRMFVLAEARGRGIGTMILQKLEEVARKEGVKVTQLETDPLQLEAIKLYYRFGYSERGAFGSYKLNPFRLFMEKRLNV